MFPLSRAGPVTYFKVQIRGKDSSAAIELSPDLFLQDRSVWCVSLLPAKGHWKLEISRAKPEMDLYRNWGVGERVQSRLKSSRAPNVPQIQDPVRRFERCVFRRERAAESRWLLGGPRECCLPCLNPGSPAAGPGRLAPFVPLARRVMAVTGGALETLVICFTARSRPTDIRRVSFEKPTWVWV